MLKVSYSRLLARVREPPSTYILWLVHSMARTPIILTSE